MEWSWGHVLVSLVAGVTKFIAYVFDWNDTHVFNPRWPPHAKFHNAQTLLLGTLLGLLALALLWAPGADRWRQFQAAVAVAALYWVAQLGSALFPGTALVDPEFRGRPGAYLPGGVPAQPVVAGGLVALLGVAYALEAAR